MRNDGFTLIETMIAITILSGVSLGLYYVNLGMTKAALNHEHLTKLQDDGRGAIMYMTRLLRISRNGTIAYVDPGTNQVATLGTEPHTNIQFEPVTDVDGNGSSLDEDYELETTGPFLFTADTSDRNGDGRTTTQLVQLNTTNNTVVRVLTNYLAASGGLTFQRTANGIQVSLLLEREGQGQASLTLAQLDQVVTARN